MGCTSSKVSNGEHVDKRSATPAAAPAAAPEATVADQFLKDLFAAQMSGALPMTLQFNKAEFNRHVDQDFIDNYEINPKDEEEVASAIKNDALLANMGSGSSSQQIAAQFKNTRMKTSHLTPQQIEAILTKMIDERKFEQPGWPPIKISYSDDSFVYEKGVRTFCFSGRT